MCSGYRMKKFLATKCFAILDIVLQLLFFSCNLGVLIWNGLHENAQDKYFPDFGDATMLVGMASAASFLELDVFLLYFVSWEFELALYWWNYVCLAFAILSWSLYMAVAIYIRSLYLGIWAFFYLYTRATLIMMAKAEYLGMFRRRAVKEEGHIIPRCPSNADLTFPSTESTATTYRVQTKSEENSQSTFITGKQVLDVDSIAGVSGAGIGNAMTFCTFLGPQAIAPDHYIARDEPVIKVNEEQGVEELKTKM